MAGVLQIGNGGTTGSVAGDIVDNARLIFNRSDTVTYGGVISGGGSLTQAGGGTLVLAGANSHSGGTTLAAGSLTLGGAGALGAGPLAMQAGTTLDFLGDYSVPNAISLSGDPTINVKAGLTDTLGGAVTDGSGPGAL
ncbi:MAG: autotransporter-associated beta strand repeat-containing protein [Caulobacteraceae bacterium]